MCDKQKGSAVEVFCEDDWWQAEVRQVHPGQQVGWNTSFGYYYPRSTLNRHAFVLFLFRLQYPSGLLQHVIHATLTLRQVSLVHTFYTVKHERNIMRCGSDMDMLGAAQQVRVHYIGGADDEDQWIPLDR
jgi:hypothetical protein